MKRVIIYALSAIALGLILTLVPIITLAELKLEPSYSPVTRFSRELDRLEGTSTRVSPYSSYDLQLLIACFAVSAVVYLWVRRRLPRRDYGWNRLPPY